MDIRIGILATGALLVPCAIAAQEPPSQGPHGADEIVVTGERIPRTELDTAASVVVITGKDADRASADRLDQLLTLVPNVQLGSGEEGPAIRGQDATGQLRNLFAFLGGTRPRVTLTVDGRSVTYYEFIGGVQSAWDLQQIEVFRSPQTTTQGRNSIAGAIFVTTGLPSSDWEGRGRAIIGDFDTRQLSAMLSGPLVRDELAIRISGDLRLAKVSNHMTDSIPGADIDRDEFGTGRVKLRYQPVALPGALIESTFAYTKSQSPQFEGISPPFRDRRLPVPNQMIGVMKVEAASITSRAEYEIKPGLRSSLTVSYGDSLLNRFGLPGLGRARADSSDFSIEPTLYWEREGRFSLLIGAHRFSANQDQTIDISAFGIGTGSFDDEQDSLGLFGEASWRPHPAISMTGGLRYQRDRQVRLGAIGAIALDYDRTFDAWLPKLSLSYDLSGNVTAGVLAQRAYNPGGTTLSLARRAEDPFEPETLWNYEAFLRATTADGRARFAANLFYNDIKNAQRPRLVPLLLPNGSTTYVDDFANAPAARSYGLEAALDWQARNNLQLRVAMGLLETKVVRTLDPGDVTLGKEFQRSPGFSASGSIDWQPIEKFQLSAQIRHQSGYFSDDKNDSNLRIGASTVVDGRASYGIGPVTLFAYARNLFDKFYMTYLFNPALGTAGKPREVGAGAEVRF